MCSVFGAFDFDGDAGLNTLLKGFTGGKMYVTQHAVLLNENHGADVYIESVLEDIYTIVTIGKSEKETATALLKWYLENDKKSVPILKGSFSFFIYDEKQKRLCVVIPKN